MAVAVDFNKLAGLRGFLTEGDITDGLRGDCDKCPIALAVGRMFPDYEVNVDGAEASIHTDGEVHVKFVISQGLGNWIDSFDNENEVSPITLVIRASEGADYQYELCLLAEQLVTLKIRAEVERIPQGDTPAFQSWCEKHNVMVLGGERRGWFGNVNSYLHDAAYVVYPEDAESGTPFLLSEAEYQKAFIGGASLEERLTQILTDFAEHVDDEQWKYVPVRITNTVHLILDAFGVRSSEKDIDEGEAGACERS